uniref:Uncharacterized protein n=1 Tax=Phlebotomus papatasi TaxID=29031 RepID=A0A1B0DDS7_PHLPP
MESFDSSLRQFWEIDSVPQTSSEKSESIEAEEQFKNTTVRTESGRYMVQLPFKENLSLLENNRSSAVQQYYSLEKKMKSDQNLKDQYNNIIKEPLCQIPDPDLGTEKYGCLKRWQLCQKISQDLSRRWKMEYLHNLQQRAKWCKSHADLKVGDLVLVKNDQSPSTIWPMGRVIQTFPGIDQRVRVVEIKTSSGIIKRPISQLVKLPFDENPE